MGHPRVTMSNPTVVLVALCVAGCASGAESQRADGDEGDDRAPGAGGVPVADVVGVRVTGDPGAYRFAVTVRSPDTGCGQYADWWEVVKADQTLAYRRILAHSHVGEQPFTRSGGAVEVPADERVFVRAHMAPGGYGGAVMAGEPGDGDFTRARVPPGFAADLEHDPPQPDGCAF